MTPPSTADWRLIGLVLLMSWPMQLHAKHIPAPDPLAIPGFALLVYVAWPIASLALLYGHRRDLAGAWLFTATMLTVGMVATDGFEGPPPRLLALGIGAAVTACAAAWAGGLRPGHYGLGPGRWRQWAPAAVAGALGAVALVQVGAVLSPELVAFYPVYTPARESLSALVGWEVAMVAYMACWEAWFRGVFLFGARRSSTATTAILLQAIPFFLLHSNTPELEMATSIVGGIFLGGFCLWARSCWPAAVWHATLYVTMELTGAWIRSSPV